MGLLKFRKQRSNAAKELAKASNRVQEVLGELPMEIDKQKLIESGKELKKQGVNLANDLGRAVAGWPGMGRFQPQKRRKFSLWRMILGGTILAAAVGAVWVALNPNRREKVRSGINQASNKARDKYVQLGGVSGAVQVVKDKFADASSKVQDDFEGQVLRAVAANGEIPEGLHIEVEGRTVYLKGQVKDPAVIDVVAERAQNAQGVAAVVNHTTLA